MGLSSSTCRYCFLESRSDDIRRKLSLLSAQKIELSRNSAKLSSEYQKALNSKTLKLSYNNGVTYCEMSYSNLMSPNAINSNKPLLITNSSNKVVISDNYKKYAEIISPDGSASQKYTTTSDTRKQILTEIVGITEEDLDNYDKQVSSTTNTITAEQKSLIEFYDTLFTTISNNGWSYDKKIEDSEFLDQTLQNGYYYLTNYTKEPVDDENYKYDYTYYTDYAVNNSQVYTVNNSTKNDAALAKYEADKARLSRKESLIDTWMKKLETEDSSIQKMMESVKNTRDKNIESMFKFDA